LEPEVIVSERRIVITKFDKERLEELLAVAEEFSDHGREYLHALRAELAVATVVSPEAVPQDVVTMNSKVVLRDVDTSEEMTYSLTFPKNADVDAGYISILAPVGTAILGYTEGDVIEWPVPSGMRRIRIEKILYQPEAAGDFYR